MTSKPVNFIYSFTLSIYLFILFLPLLTIENEAEAS
jgi:hypothetical protein